MPVDILYEGLTIARGAPARPEGDGLFVELEAPMPVGTRLIIRDESGESPARVERVHEGVGPGVLVKLAAAAGKAVRPAPVAQEVDAVPQKVDVEASRGSSREAVPSGMPAPIDPEEPDSGRRRRRKKTLPGR